MVAVNFFPQSAGTKSASLTFTDNSAGSPQIVALSGTATVGARRSSFSADLEFRTQSSGSSSAPKQFTVTNTGSSSVSISVAMSGTNARILSRPTIASAERFSVRIELHGERLFDPGCFAARSILAYGNDDDYVRGSWKRS